MITFDPFWQLMEERKITTYKLMYAYGMNPAEINRLKHDHNYTLRYVEHLCCMFSCQLSELISYLPLDYFKKKSFK